MITDALAVLDALPPSRPAAETAWPGVDDPDVLREQVAGWLAQYANSGTRRTYALALGLPVTWADAIGGGSEPATGGRRPPAAARGRLHDVAWFRWCAARGLDPREATGAHVTAWLHALSALGAARRTQQRMLSTLSALYGHLAVTGVVSGNPAALHRGRLGLTGGARDASPTVRLTPEQLAALLAAAPTLHFAPDRAVDRLLARRAVAVVALLTLGLRISELTGLDRSDRYRTGGEDVLRVVGKGGRHREVYLTALAADALEAYLAERDRFTGAAVPALRGSAGTGSGPMIATRHGARCSRTDLYRLLRRIAAAGGPELDGVVDRVHPHALRHAYVTIALENGVPIQHVRADVGHASISTTEHYDRGLRTRATTGADAVAAAINRS
ncbi:tyrosine-type recombinase/integrase [Pseudonocardia sp. CA-107938]|uniref:tyrosine-type recombinase/integrase n=1 Tax=Pseudonocardia sp. CA-107938 TaxID=3240021 RepID=UPI003D8F7D51